MRTLIIILIISSFIQSTIFPFDLVLIILLCRAFLKTDKSNLYLAFFFGLFISHLTLTPMGVQSILLVTYVAITQSLSKSRLSQNPLSLIPISLFAIAINQIALWAFSHESIQMFPKIYGGVLSLPIFYIVRFWEERFIVRKEIRLRV